MHDLRWPDRLWIARHGQSAGNVARDAAEAAGLPLIDLAARDIDVPLSPLGERQSIALGEWFGAAPEPDRPTAVLCSPYLRARETARLLIDAGGLEPQCGIHVDERLREKEFGVLDRLTTFGIRERHPDLSSQRAHVGKFYFRPPGGESWCDVILRLRSVVDTMKLEFRGERVLIVAHQVIVNCFRYLLEKLDERAILDIDREADVPNCGVTEYRLDPARGALRLVVANFTAPLREAGEPVTREPDVQAAPKS